MRGDIDEESIIENKPAIKNYWENKMKEHNAASQFARTQIFGQQPSPTIIDKMNEEIREDYIRNLELLHDDEGLPHSSASDTSEPIEFDSFDMASSGSSPYGQLMSESPTLIDSGHQSQESHVPPDPEHDDNETEEEAGHETSFDEHESISSPISSPPSSSSSSPLVPPSVNQNNNQTLKRTLSHHGSDFIGIPKLGQQQAKFTNNSTTTTTTNNSNRVVPNVGGYRTIGDSNRQSLNGQGKIENHVTRYIAFNKPFSIKVKPFEEPTTTTTEDRDIEQRTASQEEQLPVKSTKSDISYLLATSRLKKEIEDNLKREKELKDQGRVRTLSVETVVSSSSISPSQAQEFLESKQQQQQQQQQSTRLPTQKKPQVEATETPTPIVVERRSEEPEKRTNYNQNEDQPKNVNITKKITVVEKSGSINQNHSSHNNNNSGSTSTNTNTNNNNNNNNTNPSSHSSVDNNSTNNAKLQQQSFPNFKIGKNFNSLERYIMYSSMTKLNFRSMPPAWTNGNGGNSGGNSPNTNSTNNANTNAFEFEDVEQSRDGKGLQSFSVVPSADEETNQEEVEPVEKIRKNYVPTEKRIKDELLEMVQREEELKKTRQSQWKSTPNLSNLNLSDDEEEQEDQQQQQHQKTQEMDTPVLRRQQQQQQQQQSPRLGVEKRRRSALITKWEDMISRNNPN